MKVATGWVLSWALFWCGHAVSKLMHMRGLGRLYAVYNRLMCWSVAVQDWSGAGPWEPARD